MGFLKFLRTAETVQKYEETDLKFEETDHQNENFKVFEKILGKTTYYCF